MEFVVVEFPEERDVLLDGQVAGKTNQTLMVEEGNHLFELGDPKDYSPTSQEMTVENTTSINPLRVTFTPNEGTA